MTNLTEASDRDTKEFERIIRSDPTLTVLFTRRMPSYRYFSVGKDQYFWTTEAVKHGGKPRYASGIYRYLKTKKAFKLVNERYHVKRKDAKARALKLWEERKD